MLKAILIVPAAVLAIVMTVCGLWAWRTAPDLVLVWDFARPDLVVWAIRSAAIAIVAAAQLVILLLIAGRIYQRGMFDLLVTFAAASVCVMASIGAVACGLAGR